MNTVSKLTRREFIRLAGIITAGLSFVSGCLTPRRADEKVLSDDEESLLNAIVEQIIPTDEWLGGRDAGVVNFIQKQLEGPYRRFQGDYRKGLAAIMRNCLEKFNKKFEALPWEQQTSFLTDMESGSLMMVHGKTALALSSSNYCEAIHCRVIMEVRVMAGTKILSATK